MRKGIKEIQLFISCPGDINEEKKIIREVVDDWNRNIGSSNKLFILIKHWKLDSYPSLGRPQDLINSQVFDKSDIVVGVFWTYFGSSTGKFKSGTEEEIKRARSMGLEVMLYFSKRKTSLDSISTEQYNNILKFKEEFKNSSLYWEYKSLKEFKKFFSNHLASLMNDKFINKMKPVEQIAKDDILVPSKLTTSQIKIIMENNLKKEYAPLSELEDLIKQNFLKNFQNIFHSNIFEEIKKNSEIRFKEDKKIELENIKNILFEWEKQIALDCKIFRDSFNLELLKEFEGEYETFKDESFSTIPWTVKAALKTPDEELIRYKAAYASTPPKLIFDTVKKILTRAKNYHEKMKIDYSNIKKVKDLKLQSINDPELLLPGVVGLGIRSEILYRLYPSNFSIMTRKSIWGMYFLVGENIDFIKFEKNRDNEYRISHDWEYDYERFTYLCNIIANLLEIELKNYKVSMKPMYRFAYVGYFLNIISKNNEELIDSLISWKK